MGRFKALWRSVSVGFLLLTAGVVRSASPSDAACDAVHAAYNKMFRASPRMITKNSGAVNVTKAIGEITGSGSYQETCKFLRDEPLDGEPAAVYSEGFTSKAGNTNGIVWISKRTGATLRQEVDVDLGSKGKGHQSIRFEYAKK
jgi:hypothetical protein